MKTKILLYALFASVCVSLQSCAVVGGIFKAGMATGIIAIVLVVAIIVFIIAKVAGGKK